MEFSSKQGLAAAVAAALALWTAQASAEPGFFVGASIGQSTTEFQENNVFGTGENIELDEDEDAYKFFGGYMFNDYLGVELGYVDLGQPEDKFTFGLDGAEAIKTEGEVSGFTANVLGQIPLGPVDLFAKVGLISYDAEVEAGAYLNDVLVGDKAKFDDDGEDLMYGVGGTFNIGNFGIRAEYEMYDVGELDDLSLISIGGQIKF